MNSTVSSLGSADGGLVVTVYLAQLYLWAKDLGKH